MRWGGRLPFGLTLLCGARGAGKTALCASVVSRVTRGVALEDDDHWTRARNVLWLGAKDRYAEVRDQVRAAGATSTRVYWSSLDPARIVPDFVPPERRPRPGILVEDLAVGAHQDLSCYQVQELAEQRELVQADLVVIDHVGVTAMAAAALAKMGRDHKAAVLLVERTAELLTLAQSGLLLFDHLLVQLTSNADVRSLDVRTGAYAKLEPLPEAVAKQLAQLGAPPRGAQPC